MVLLELRAAPRREAPELEVEYERLCGLAVERFADMGREHYPDPPTDVTAAEGGR